MTYAEYKGMTVEELIQRLKNMPQQAIVYYDSDGVWAKIWKIENDEDGVYIF